MTQNCENQRIFPSIKFVCSFRNRADVHLLRKNRKIGFKRDHVISLVLRNDAENTQHGESTIIDLDLTPTDLVFVFIKPIGAICVPSKMVTSRTKRAASLGKPSPPLPWQPMPPWPFQCGPGRHGPSFQPHGWPGRHAPPPHAAGGGIAA